MLRSLHERTGYTAKSMTQRLVESSQPICNILGKNEIVNKDNVIVRLYRLQKMYAAKADASKILMNLLMLEFDPATKESD